MRLRSVTITDVTPELASAANGLGVAEYWRIDGKVPSAGAAPDGSYSCLLASGASQTIFRQLASEFGVERLQSHREQKATNSKNISDESIRLAFAAPIEPPRPPGPRVRIDASKLSVWQMRKVPDTHIRRDRPAEPEPYASRGHYHNEKH